MDHVSSQLLTAEELAARLRVSPDTIKVWAREKRIPTVRLGHKTLRFDFAEVMRAVRGVDGRKGVARG